MLLVLFMWKHYFCVFFVKFISTLFNIIGILFICVGEIICYRYRCANLSFLYRVPMGILPVCTSFHMHFPDKYVKKSNVSCCT